MKRLLYNIDLYPDEFEHYSNCALLLNNGVVEEIYEDYGELIGHYPSIDGQGKVALPGFIDVHTHGGYGYDFLKQPQKAAKVYSKQCVKEGCTAYLASFVSEEQQFLVDALHYYRDLKDEGYAECIGVHLEGPFLNTKYQAVMREGTLREPSLSEFKELLEAADGKITDMTIAPELQGAKEVMNYGYAHNVTMMLGHSDASLQQAKEAIQHHAVGLTHMYNAMSPHSHRQPGLVSAGFLLNDLLCELIVDGFHVHPEVVKATYQIVKAERLALVTDSSLIKGLEDGTYQFSGQTVNKQGIQATVASTGRIAGSVVGMIDCVRNMMSFTDCSLNEIVAMACVNPSKIANVSERKGKLLPGYDGDIVLLDEQLNVLKTFVKGKIVYEQEG